jgi:SAM-dependent methyltransferase
MDKVFPKDLRCRLTGGNLRPVFDLGEPCVSDFIKPGEEGVRAPLCVGVSDPFPFLPQLIHSYPPEKMYRKYHYRSGVNAAMQEELQDVVRGALRRASGIDGTWLDIACNDGTLLQAASCETQGEYHLFGIDPSDVALQAVTEKHVPYVLGNGFFTADFFRAMTAKKADIITCIAMFYDLDDPIKFLLEVEQILSDDGLFVLQVHHAGMQLDTNAFDAICHEHAAYYNSEQLHWCLKEVGFAIVDAEITSSNGGSIRLYVKKNSAARDYIETIEGLTGYERWNCIRTGDEKRSAHGSPVEQWQMFCSRIERRRRETLSWLIEQEANGKKVIGYGASTKGNTLLQFYGITPYLMPCIADRQPHKWGKVCAGSDIPIISEAEMRAMKPDYLFVLPWHFVDGFRQREAKLLAEGTKLVSPLPFLRVWE